MLIPYHLIHCRDPHLTAKAIVSLQPLRYFRHKCFATLGSCSCGDNFCTSFLRNFLICSLFCLQPFIFTWFYRQLCRVLSAVYIIQSGAGVPGKSLTDVEKKPKPNHYSNLFALKRCIHSTDIYVEKTSTRERVKSLVKTSGPVYLFIRWEAKKINETNYRRKKENKKALSLSKYDKMV